MQQRGKSTQLFVAEESAYGTTPTLLSSHFMRHISASLDFNPYNRVFSPEKKNGPGRFAIFDRKGTASGAVEALLRPSGTINTLPECSAFLKAAFGSVVNTALSTTVASGGTTTGATLASGTGATVGASILLTCPDGRKRGRILASVAGAVVTWAPALPAGQSPANASAVKLGAAYKLTSALAISLSIARYTFQADGTAGLPELLKGFGVDRLSMIFDWQDEPRFTANGPAKTKVDAGTNPGTVQVGTNPPSALKAEAMVAGTVSKYMKMAIEITNGLVARNNELDTQSPNELYRMGDRDISVSWDMEAENAQKTVVYDPAMAGTLVSLFQQQGDTEGKIVICYAPRVEIVPPTVDVPDGAVNWPFRGRALESTEDANDELVLGLL